MNRVNSEKIEIASGNNKLINTPEEEVITCRICLQSQDLYELISPCKCAGSVKYVHKECLK